MLVGVFLSVVDSIILDKRLPHARGGVSPFQGKKLAEIESSPCSWGCFLLHYLLLCWLLVFPMLVGVFPGIDKTFASSKSLPHARGGVS